MAAVYCATMACEPTTAHNAQENLKFRSTSPCTKCILNTGFEDFRTFLYSYMNVVKVFVRYELLVAVPVAIFLPSEDWPTVRIILLSCFVPSTGKIFDKEVFACL